MCKETVVVPKSSTVLPPTKTPTDDVIGKPPIASPRKKRRRNAWSGSKDAPKVAATREPSAESTPEPVKAEPAKPEPAKPAKKKFRERFRRPEKMVPPDAYTPDEGHLATIKLLGVVLALAVVFSMLPAVKYLNLQTAPGWARVVLLVGVLQLFFIAWVLNGPDWASVWVLMLVFAVVSALYGMATAVAVATPLDKPMLLGMGEVRDTAGRWCGAVLMVMSLATYLCGRTAARWRRSFELGTARIAKKRLVK